MSFLYTNFSLEVVASVRRYFYHFLMTQMAVLDLVLPLRTTLNFLFIFSPRFLRPLIDLSEWTTVLFCLLRFGGITTKNWFASSSGKQGELVPQKSDLLECIASPYLKSEQNSPALTIIRVMIEQVGADDGLSSVKWRVNALRIQ